MNPFCVYVTTHPSGHFYIGKGKTDLVLSGKYKGSGVRLKAAFLIYPSHEWTSRVLSTFPSEEAAYDRERSLVTWDVLCHPFCLNTHIGGRQYKYNHLTSQKVTELTKKKKRQDT